MVPASNEPPPTPADLYIGSVTRLAERFGYSLVDLGEFHAAAPDELPAAYRTLLAHTGHMTVTLEAFHGTLVDVRVLRETADETSYAREIVLARQSDGAVVQYGLMRIWLADLPAEVRHEIETHDAPLGRVLIRHGLLRDVELISLWRITPSRHVASQFGGESTDTIYGRSAQILVDGRPTVQMLETVRV